MGINHFRSYDLNLLLMLHVLLEERSVTRTAERMGMAQSAVSRALAKLRDQLGDDLLIRAPGGMAPTPRAAAMKAPLAQLLDDLGALLHIGTHFNPASMQRIFRIATADHPLMLLMPALIEQINTLAPHVQFEVDTLDASFDNALVSGELDLIICPKRDSSAGIIWSPLLTDRFVTIARKNHPRLATSLTLEAFLTERHILATPGPSTTQAIVDRKLEVMGHTRHVAVRVPTFLAALRLVLATDLIATLPEGLVRQSVDDGDLRVFEPPVSLGQITLFSAWHERMRRDPAHAWFRECLQHVAQGTPISK